jgi:hypothetical protein
MGPGDKHRDDICGQARRHLSSIGIQQHRNIMPKPQPLEPVAGGRLDEGASPTAKENEAGVTRLVAKVR